MLVIVFLYLILVTLILTSLSMKTYWQGEIVNMPTIAGPKNMGLTMIVFPCHSWPLAKLQSTGIARAN